MNQEEYEIKKAEFEEKGKVTREVVENAPRADNLDDDDIDQMINVSKMLISEKEKDEILKEEDEKEKKELLDKFGGETLSKIPELSDFLKSEEHLTLGTHAKIPVPIEIGGTPVKVYVRALSRKELMECRQRASAKGHNDVDYEAILMVCTTYDGRHYTEEELSLLGYGHMQTIGEAIMIASGESPENTQSAMKKHLVDEFLEKFTA